MSMLKTGIDIEESFRDGRFNPQGAFQFQVKNIGTSIVFFDIVDATDISQMRIEIDVGESQAFGGQIEQCMVQDLYYRFVGGSGRIQFIIERVLDGVS